MIQKLGIFIIRPYVRCRYYPRVIPHSIGRSLSFTTRLYRPQNNKIDDKDIESIPLRNPLFRSIENLIGNIQSATSNSTESPSSNSKKLKDHNEVQDHDIQLEVIENDQSLIAQNEEVDIVDEINKFIAEERQKVISSLNVPVETRVYSYDTEQAIHVHRENAGLFDLVCETLKELAAVSSYSVLKNTDGKQTSRLFKSKYILTRIPEIEEEHVNNKEGFEEIVRELTDCTYMGQELRICKLMHTLMHSTDPQLASFRDYPSYYQAIEFFVSRLDNISVGRLLFQMQSVDNLDPDTQVFNIILKGFVSANPDPFQQITMVRDTLKNLGEYGLKADLATMYILLSVIPDYLGLKRGLLDLMRKLNLHHARQFHGIILNHMVLEKKSADAMIEYYNNQNPKELSPHSFNTIIYKLLFLDNNFIDAWYLVSSHAKNSVKISVSTLTMFLKYAKSLGNIRLMLYLSNTFRTKFGVSGAKSTSYILFNLGNLRELPSYWKLLVNFYLVNFRGYAIGKADSSISKNLKSKLQAVGKEHGIEIDQSKDVDFRLLKEIKRLQLTSDNLMDVLRTKNSDSQWIDDFVKDFYKRHPERIRNPT